MSSPSFSISRTIVTPVVTVLFMVSTVSGIMLFYKWNPNLVRNAHEWLGLGFGALGIWHLVRNWKAFTQYFKRKPALGAFAVTAVVAVAMISLTGTNPSPGGGPGAMVRALSNAPLETAAPVFGLTADKAILVLKGANIEATNTDTLAAIGTKAGTNAVAVASILNGQKPRPPQP
ncbi:DUF4405 domain-containing protein [Azospirillum sp. sgz302134]